MGCKIIEKKLAQTFRWYGELVGRRPFPFLVIPLILTLLIGPGLLTLKYDDDVVMLFTPYNAPSRHEQEVARQFSHTRPSNDQNSSNTKFVLPESTNESYSDMWFNLQITSDDNVMTQHSWTVISQLVSSVYENFTCQVDDWVENPDASSTVSNRKSLSASSRTPYTLQYRRDFCNVKQGCVQVDTMVNRLRDLLNTTKYGNSNKVKLTYPIMYVWDHPFNWGQYIFGVKFNPETGKLESARLVNIYFQFQVNSGDIRDQQAAKSCVRQLTDYTRKWNSESIVRDAGLSFLPINEPFVSDEVARTRQSMPASLTATIIIITIFIGISSFQRRFASLSVLGAGMGVLTVGLSLLTSFGFLCLCGVHMNFVIMVTPFLVLCVGIDNDFLVTSAWRQTNDGQSTVQRRLGRAFADCGPSLTITSINDILCFGVGYLSETPAVADFCLHTCVALLFRFLFQLTFFAAVTVYIGRREIEIDSQGNSGKRINIFRFFKTPSVAAVEALPKKSIPSAFIDFEGLQRSNSVVQPIVIKDHQRIHHFFRQTYTTFLMRKSVRAVTAVIYTVYIVAAVIGAAKWIIDISPQKLFYDDSLLKVALNNQEKWISKEAIIGRVYVTAPPDFRSKANLNRFFQFVQDLADLDTDFPFLSSNKNDKVDLWLRQYVDFLEFIRSSDDSSTDSDQNGLDQSDFYDYLPAFLQTADYNRYLADVRFKPDHENQTAPLRLDKFQFVVSYFRTDKNPFSYDDHVQMMLRWREVCRNYSDYKPLVYDNMHMNSYYDQRLTLAPTCLQTMGIALLSMSVVTALLMPDVRSMFFICLSFLSVDVGVIAGLNLWKCDLDPTSMAFVLMTIGFSVYYTARVCYCYQSSSRSLSSEEKMRRTMETVGWPILQGAVATLLGILPVVFLQCYMIRVFYRTVILVVIIGLAHGLLMMPVLMSAFERKTSPLSEFRQNLTKRSYRRKDSGTGQSHDTLSVCSN